MSKGPNSKELYAMFGAIFTALATILRRPRDLRQALKDAAAAGGKEGNIIAWQLLDTLAACVPRKGDLGLELADRENAKGK
jgi:hypothetical protein